MTPREKLIEKVANHLSMGVLFPEHLHPAKVDELCKELAEATIDFLQIQPDKFGDVKFNIHHILDEEPEKTLEQSIKELQQFVEEKGIEFPSHEELLKMRED